MTMTATIMDGMALHGSKPSQSQEDRPYPAAEETEAAISDMFALLPVLFTDTACDGDIDDMLWGMVNVFHRKIDRIAKQIDLNSIAIKELLPQQDGSEIMSGKLEEKQIIGDKLVEHEQEFTDMFNNACDQYFMITGKAWKPFTGSVIRKNQMTASVIEAREFIHARNRQRTEQFIPGGPKVAFAGSPNGGDIHLVEAALNASFRKYPDMVLVHSGYNKGDDLIASTWATRNKIEQIICKPNLKLGKRALFKRNEDMIEIGLTGVIIFPGNGPTKNLGQKAKEAGIPVLDKS